MLSTWLTLLLCVGSVSAAVFLGTDRSGKPDFYRQGDILIGFIDRHTWSQHSLCDGQDPGVVQAAHAVHYYLDQTVNKDPNILPNITVGLVAMDTCNEVGTGVYKSTSFIPLSECSTECCPNPGGFTPRCYEVAATVIPRTSTASIAISQLLSLYKIPHISIWATSNELSNKAKYPFFSRTVPPDRFQAVAIIDVIKYFNWTYISLIRYNTDYSRDGTDYVYRLAKANGICVAYSVEMRLTYEDEDYDGVVKGLLANKKARAVVAFTEKMDPMFEAIERAGAIGVFTFIVSDGVNTYYLKESAINTIKVKFPETSVDDTDAFLPYYRSLPAFGSNTESWWYQRTDLCTWNVSVNDTRPDCRQYKTVGDIPNLYIGLYPRWIRDAVKAIVLGLHNMITARCPQAFKDKSHLRPCMDGKALQDQIRKVTFQGQRWIQFDSNGDGYPAYSMSQWQYRPHDGGNFSEVKVADWAASEGLNMSGEGFVWFEKAGSQGFVRSDMIESVCAKPCKPGEFYIQGELKCCWECRRCRTNERIRDDQAGCVQCPELTWPDRLNVTTCLDIPPTYMLWLDPIAFGLCSLAALGIASTLAIVYVFLRYREKKVIKGSSMEQMMTIIMAMLMSHVTIFLLVMKPNTWGCRTAYVTFHSSCTLIFVPLLLKTTRLYRIFAAAEKCQQEVKFVSRQALTVFSIILLVLLVVLLAVCFVLYPVGSKLQMPIRTTELVELVCSMTMEAILAPLTYNLTILLLCAVYGFLTRKLPDNFNESWYIFISVSTTLFVWIAFLPTYFMAFYAYHKGALLSLALILNAYVTSLCLFAPKIYAVYFIDDSKIKVTNFEDPANKT